VSDVDRLAREFVTLALRLDRLAPGLVGAYLGGPALHRAVAAEPAPDPAALARDAAAVAAAVPGAGLAPCREQVLLVQLAALQTTAERLAGRVIGYRSEAEQCLGVPVRPGEEDGYRAAHLELDALLPGRGQLADRMAAYRRSAQLRPDRLLPAARALAGELRGVARDRYRLPAGESVAFEAVSDAPWAGLHQPAGYLRSVVRVNRSARLRVGQLAQLVAHESYPGHHTELCRLRAGALAAGEREHEVVLVLSPCSTVSEGLADAALAALVGPGWGRWAARVLDAVGVPVDGELTEAVEAALSGLLRVRQDAALLLHDPRAGADAARRHLRRWLLVDDGRADRMLAFLAHPVWRIYTTAYVEGYQLVRAHLGADQATAAARHATLVGRPTVPALLGSEHAVCNIRPCDDSCMAQ
jgi:hypothetical protein